MMYSYAITVPPNTAYADPVIEEVKLPAGLISHVEVEFPAGCAGLVHVVVTEGLHQVWPTNPEGDLASDGYVIPWDEHIEITEPTLRLEAVVWSDDDTYAHTVTVRITVLPAGLLEAAQKSQSIIQRIGAVLFGGR